MILAHAYDKSGETACEIIVRAVEAAVAKEQSLSFDGLIKTIPSGWLWKLEHFYNRPWAVQYAMTLYPAHEEPQITTYGKTPAEAIRAAILRAT